MLINALLIICAICLFSASASSHDVLQEAPRHVSQRASVDLTLDALGIRWDDLKMMCQCFDLSGMGESHCSGAMIRGLPATEITFLTEKQISDYGRYLYGTYLVTLEKDYRLKAEHPLEKLQIPRKGLYRFLGGSICAALARVILCDPAGDGSSIVDPRTMEDRIRLLVTLNVQTLYLGRLMSEWMPILEKRLKLPAGSKDSLLFAIMTTTNEAYRKKEKQYQFERNLKYKRDIDSIEQHKYHYIFSSGALQEFYGTVFRFCLVKRKLEEMFVEISEEEMVELIQVAMQSSDFLRIIPYLLDFADNDTEQNNLTSHLTTEDKQNRKQKRRHVAELIRTEIRRDQKREYIRMVVKSDMHPLSDELKNIFSAHISGYL